MRLNPWTPIAAMILVLGHSTIWAAGTKEPPKASSWVEYRPGGDALCGRGEDYAFFVHHGNSTKVLIDFIGGGACWNAENCSVDDATFVDSVNHLRRETQQGKMRGFYDKSNESNPFKDWTHILVPYCTGDIHWGANDVTYQPDNGPSFKIHHRGGINAKAVLDWVETHAQAEAQQVMVTGCSAGSYGSIYWTPQIRRIFPGAQIAQLGDSGAGITTKEFTDTTIDSWRAATMAPTWIPGLDPRRVDWKTLRIEDIYQRIGAYYPEVTLTQFNTASDTTQAWFFSQMGGEEGEWGGRMRRSVQAISGTTPNFRYYLGAGIEHCIIPNDSFYATVNSDVSFSAWFKAVAAGERVNNVVCDHCVSP